MLVLFSYVIGAYHCFSMIKERKQIPKLLTKLNLDEIVHLKFADQDFGFMSTFTCCEKTTAFWYVLVTTESDG